MIRLRQPSEANLNEGFWMARDGESLKSWSVVTFNWISADKGRCQVMICRSKRGYWTGTVATAVLVFNSCFCRCSLAYARNQKRLQGVRKLFILTMMLLLHISRIVMMILGFKRGLHRCVSLAIGIVAECAHQLLMDLFDPHPFSQKYLMTNLGSSFSIYR
jgi:hypothetical protein